MLPQPQFPQSAVVNVQQGTTGQFQPTVINYPSTSQSKVVEKYPKRTSISLGIALIVAAILSFLFNIIDLAVGLNYDGVNGSPYRTPATWGMGGQGFWVGAMVCRPIVLLFFMMVACRGSRCDKSKEQQIFFLQLHPKHS